MLQSVEIFLSQTELHIQCRNQHYVLNGTGNQTFTVNLAAPLSLNKLTIDKPVGVALNFAGTQSTINVAE